MIKITPNIKKSLVKIKEFLIKKNKDIFTKSDFLANTYSSSYYFKQMVEIGLIIDTGKVYSHRQGSPIAYKLNDLIFNLDQPKQYKLTNEDLTILIDSKSKKLTSLNDSIKVMRNQISNLEKQKNTLSSLKNGDN